MPEDDINVEFSEPKSTKGPYFTDKRAEHLRNIRIPIAQMLAGAAGQLTGEVLNTARHPIIAVPRATRGLSGMLAAFADNMDAVTLDFAEILEEKRLQKEHDRNRRAAEELDSMSIGREAYGT